VLEILLFYGYARRNTNGIAHRMIKEFGSLHNLLDADVDTLIRILKCSENIAVLLNLIPKLANRYLTNKWQPIIKRIALDKKEIAAEFVIDLLTGYTLERFYVICLDTQLRIINVEFISEGVVDEAAVYPRKVIDVALKNNASAVILAHNHPAGTNSPSSGDKEATRRISEAFQTMGIAVIDHIIAAGNTFYSFAARKNYFVTGYK